MTSPSLIQEVAIEKILDEHLWNEIMALEAKIQDLSQQSHSLIQRKTMLEKIAEIANIRHPDD